MGPGIVERQLPSAAAVELLNLTQELAQRELAPLADETEARGEFPRQIFRLLGEVGLLSLPFTEDYGGGAQPYEVYLQVLEELSRAWLAVGLGVSVHTLSCHALAIYGTSAQQDRWLGELIGGELLGAYCLSEPHCGSDAAALRTTAKIGPDGYTISGTKAWVTHGGVADFYTVLARTGGAGAGGISAFLVAADSPGLQPSPPERKMGLKSSITAQISFDAVQVLTDRRIGAEGNGFGIAMDALNAGRLGIAACAVGVAQAALDVAVTYANQRTAFGRPIVDFQGVSFLLADAAAGIEAARALYLRAARRKDAGLSFATQAAMAKLIATDTCMKVTTDMVQVLGGAGYVQDYPVERYMREAKVLQIVEGTNQVQRMLIGRSLVKP